MLNDFIDESFFLYDKCNLIKKSFITELNKLIPIYGFISYFEKKTFNELAQIVSSSKPLEFNIEKDAIKNYPGFQLTRVNSTNVTLTDKKDYDFSITKIGKKRKRPLMDPL